MNIGTVMFLLVPAVTSSATKASEREVEYLSAFARLYGYVRYFHPSDEASAVDWQKFASHGAARVAEAQELATLRSTLEELFLPIAPSLVLSRTVTGRSTPLPPDFAEGVDVVAWRHRGVGLGHTPYASARTHRRAPPRPMASNGFGTITQAVEAEAFRGRRIRLRAAVKTAVRGEGQQAQLWLRVDRANDEVGFFDNMGDRPITSLRWQRYEIVGDVAPDAPRIVFGGFLKGIGVAWLDAFELEVETRDGSWSAVALANPGFEASSRTLEGWAAKSIGYSYAVDRVDAFEGELSATIETRYEPMGETLFEARPIIGESIREELLAGLHCDVPLALYGDPLNTYPIGDADALSRLFEDVRSGDGDARALRLGAVIELWNVFQHFYPYFDVVRADWDHQLSLGIRAALGAETDMEFYEALQRMTAPLEDGHLRVYNRELERDIGFLPLVVDWVEDEIVVTSSAHDDIRIGDIIERVDDVPVFEILAEEEVLISGSPQWRRYRLLSEFGRGPNGSVSTLTLQRGTRTLAVELERTNRKHMRERQRPALDVLDDGVHYVDLSRARMDEISERIDELAAARGVVLDLRGYPASNHGVIHHLIDEPVQSARWMVPRIIYSDRKDLVGYDTSGRWHMEPKKPRFQGRVVFLIDGRAISYAESFLGIIEHYRLAEIVGQPTAGTNGNVNRFELSGGFQLSWTGMKVLKHDGSQHHLIGIRPTVPVARTIDGVREGRDEFIERALELINAETK